MVKRARGEFKDLGYAFHWDFENNPLSVDNAIDKRNTTPRTFAIHCDVQRCIWNLSSDERGDGLGNCDRYEAWNVLEISELEIDDMMDCPWYSGRRGRSLWSITPKH